MKNEAPAIVSQGFRKPFPVRPQVQAISLKATVRQDNTKWNVPVKRFNSMLGVAPGKTNGLGLSHLSIQK
jgi:hypothetical protein